MRNILTTILLAALISSSFGVETIRVMAAGTAQDQFIVSQQVIDSPDNTAPSVPADLNATAVSTSQINLSWTASTDNASVAGYQVFRDGLFIATSTATTYSDIGLTPDTLYSYTVTAFDPSINISAQSAPASDTTFVVPPPTQDDNDGATGGGRVIVLRYLSVSPDLQSALIQFGTNVPVQATVFWGKTADYELGSSASSLYALDHTVRLDGLTPSTRYFFKIELVDGYGRRLVVERQEFTTLSLPDVSAPANVTEFLATPNEKNIVLTWKNPKADFDLVRIVKSDKFYPRDPLDGEVIYEGRAERYVDEDVMLDKTYYYTAFSRDFTGNYSSGSVTDARLLRPGEEVSLPKLFAGVLQLPKEMIDKLLRNFSLFDIDFIQDGKKIPVVNNRVDIQGDRNLTISVEYEKVPEILKTIVVTMFDPDDKAKTFSFLLRINADKTAYQAQVAPLGRPGTYEFSFAILDHKHQGLVSLAGTIFSKVPELVSGDGQGVQVDLVSFLWLLLAILILMLVAYVMLRTRKEREIKPTEVLLK